MRRLAPLALAVAVAGCTPASHGIIVDLIVDEGCAGAKADVVHFQVASSPNDYGTSIDLPAHDFFHNEHELVILIPDSETSVEVDMEALVAAVAIDYPTFHYSFAGPGRYKESGGFASICPPVGSDAGLPSDGAIPDLGPRSDDLLPRLWSPVDSTTAFDLYGVWGASPDDLYVVGGQSTSLTGTMGGATWVNNSFANGNLFAVWGDGQGNVWEVGDAGGVYLKTASIGWKLISNCGNGSLFGITGDGNGDVWISGAGGLLCHATDGKLFKVQPQLGIGDINGGWTLTGQTYLFAADDGMKIDILNNAPALAAVQEASHQGLEAAGGDGSLRYLVGGGGTILVSTDGKAWDRTLLGQGYLHGVWAGGQTAYVVGDGPVIYHTTDGGAHWSEEGITVPLDATLNGVFSVGGLVIAVGAGGTILIRQ